MKTIVTATDFSAISLNAVTYAAELAVATGSRLSIIHVCALPVSFSEIAVAAENILDTISAARDQMNQLAETLRVAKPNLDMSTEISQGDVVPMIEAHCVKVKPFVVVIGSESRTAFERFLTGGGHTLKALKRFAWPLIIVPPASRFTRLHKVGLACDFKEVIVTIPAKEIREIVTQFGAELHVIYSTGNYKNAFVPEAVEQSAWLNEMIGDLKPEYHFLEGNNMVGDIDEFAVNNQIDLLIVIPKNHSVTDRMFYRSHTKDMVLHAHVPVMAIHE